VPAIVAGIREGCRPGDTILLGAAQTGAIASLCDFNQTVFSNGRDVICVMAAPRQMR
jgi:hypothetical protein